MAGLLGRLAGCEPRGPTVPVDAATADAEEPLAATPDTVGISFWHLGSRGPRRVERAAVVPAWDEIRRNCAAPVAAAVDRLAARTTAPDSGRLLLFHGPPGTGKTTVLRALAAAWEPWCSFHHVVDPERLLGVSGYLLDVLADETDEDTWRMLVLEDCDELIRGDAKAGTGQSMARLLNLTDGMLGQGARVLVCITTNEALGRLHPAITRPGRCLAEIEVGRLSRAEARAWMGRELEVGRDGATLAELLAARESDGPAPRLRAGPPPGPTCSPAPETHASLLVVSATMRDVERLPERTEGDGLELRAWTPDDVVTMEALVTANLEHLRPWMGWIAHEPLSRADRLALIVGWSEASAAAGDVVYGMWKDGVAVGGCGLHRRIGPHGLEIGYWVDVRHVGRGVATAASRALTDLAFTVEGIDVVEIHHDVENHASRRVPEKLGFVDVGTVRPERELTGTAETGLDRIWRTTRAAWLTN